MTEYNGNLRNGCGRVSKSKLCKLGSKIRRLISLINRKTKRIALYSALSAKVAEGSLIIVDDIKCAEYKTKTMVNMFKTFGFEKTYTKNYKTVTVEDGNTVYGTATREAVKSQSALVVLNGTQDANAAVILSCNNIPNVKTTQSTTLNVYDILNAEKLVMTVEAVKKLEEVYA